MPKPTAAPALRSLAKLEGRWRTEAANPSPVGPRQARGRAVFEWMRGGHYLIQRSTNVDPFPSGVSIIGLDERTKNMVMHYFDSRGVARIYRISLARGSLRIWRDHPGFSQRFFGRFSPDGRTIDGAWEKSKDGAMWEHDFDLTYRRVR